MKYLSGHSTIGMPDFFTHYPAMKQLYAFFWQGVNVNGYERDNEGVFIKVEIFEDEYNKQSKDDGY